MCDFQCQHAIRYADRRKALAAHLSDLFKVPLQQLPFYARITATLSQEYPELGSTVGVAVVRKVKGLAKNKDATNRTLEPRIASARYLAELAKFRVIDPGVPSQLPCNPLTGLVTMSCTPDRSCELNGRFSVLKREVGQAVWNGHTCESACGAGEFFLCLKRCLDDFNSHNIDTACELVVGAGAFMARQAATSDRMDNMLGVRSLSHAWACGSALHMILRSMHFVCWQLL